MHIYFLIAYFIIFISNLHTNSADSVQKGTNLNFERLPKNVIPTHYAIYLEPNLETFMIKGSETVHLNILEETTEIILNIANSTISTASFETEDNSSPDLICVQEACEININEEQETLKITFDPPLSKGKGKLHIKFRSNIQSNLKGCYRTKAAHDDHSYNIVTQFQSIDARRCFPCWDEPAFKSTFDMILKVPEDFVALSNMPVNKSIADRFDPNYRIVYFDTSSIMSTYLVAIAIGKFEYLEASEDGIIHRVYAGIGQKEQGQFGLETSLQAMKFFKDYFGISYPISKVDLIAVPDLALFAMENFGLITYREATLLLDPQETSVFNKQLISFVVTHEAAHQWFGNIVTMEWWPDLWLNEGFASFAQYLATNHIYSHFDVWSQFLSERYSMALKLDVLKHSHPIEVPINHPSEINEVFDSITYDKGASLVRMLSVYIGDKDFVKGMKMYMAKYKYQNAKTIDLWKVLEKASGKPINKVMSTWTLQMGFPLITVKALDGGGNWKLELSQEKFKSNVDDVDEKDKDYFWNVPLIFTSENDPNKTIHEVLMDKKQMDVTIPNLDNKKWVKLNSKSLGFYRVNYPPEMMTQFTAAIKSMEMHPSDRLEIFSDFYAMVQSGQKPTVELFQLLDSYIDEDDYPCWSVITEAIGKLNQLMGYSEKHKNFKSYARKILEKITKKIGWEQKEFESHKNALLRPVLLNKMIELEDEAAIKEAKKRFADYQNTQNSIHPNIRSAVYSGALINEREEMYNTFIELYKKYERLEEKERVGKSFVVLKDKKLLEKFILFSFSEEVRFQDAPELIKSICMSKEGREVAWEYFKKNWEMIRDRNYAMLLITLMQPLVENFVTKEMANEIQDFLNKNKIPGSEKVVSQGVEKIMINEAWLKRDLKNIEFFLEKY